MSSKSAISIFTHFPRKSNANRKVRHKEPVFLLKTAEKLKNKSLYSQVASQTTENLQTVSQVAHLPILRPLIGRSVRKTMMYTLKRPTSISSMVSATGGCGLDGPLNEQKHRQTECGSEHEKQIARKKQGRGQPCATRAAEPRRPRGCAKTN